MKEYGGYLPLELNNKAHFYTTNNEMQAVKLNSGRSAILLAIKDFNPSKIYIPVYNCYYVNNLIENSGYSYEYYLVDENMLPKNVVVSDDELLLFINYFGNFDEQQLLEIKNKYKNLIIDNCNAFFQAPIEGAYNTYSVRKFFGTADGAYLVGNIKKQYSFERDISYSRSIHLLKSIELGTNAAYLENKNNENEIGFEIKEMSVLTDKILSSIDYAYIQTIRRSNFMHLHELLKNNNELNINTSVCSHMDYPFLSKEKGMALYDWLIENKIYSKRLWSHLLKSDGFEGYLSRNMCFLPIDQRYSCEDMEYIANIVIRGIELS